MVRMIGLAVAVAVAVSAIFVAAADPPALGRGNEAHSSDSAGRRAIDAQATSGSGPTFTGAPGSPFMIGGDPFALATWPRHLVASNPAPGTLTVFSIAANGSLTLAPGSPLPAGGGAPEGIAAFADDQSREIVVVADAASNAVSALSDTGSGRLASVPGSPVPAGGQAPSAVAGLLGKLVAVGSARSGTVSVLSLTATGVTGPIGPAISTGLSSITALAVGDFNGDGHPDLAAVDGSGATATNISVLLGDGQSRFRLALGSPFSSGGGSPDAIAIEDYNDDGRLDFAVTNAASDTVSVWLGNGDGSFRPGPGSPFPSGGTTPTGVVAADFNGDGLADLAVTNSRSGSLALYTGRGGGQFTAQPQVPGGIGGPAPTAILSTDVNGDLRPDLIAADRQSQSIDVLLNTTVPPPVRLVRARLRRGGTVRLVLEAPAAGSFSGTLTGTGPGSRRAITYGLVTGTSAHSGPVATTVVPTRRGLRLFEAVKVLHLEGKITFIRSPPPDLSDASIPMVAASTVRRRVVSRHGHAHRLIVHVSRVPLRAR